MFMNGWFVIVIIWILAAAISWALIYSAVRLAVLHALRAHTVTSTSAVSIVSAVPLTIEQAPPVD